MARSSCSFGSFGELAADGVLDDLLVDGDELLEIVDVEIGVLGALAVLLLGGVERLVEAVVGDFRAVLALDDVRRDVHDDPAEHGDEAAVRVPAEALIAADGDEALERCLVEAEVEDRVHHARHRELGAGADRDEQRVLRIAEALARLLLDDLDGREDVVPEAGGKLLAGLEVVVAGFRGDREARGDRQTGVGHLREAGALAAQEILHPAVALALAAAPCVDVALGGLVGLAGVGHRSLVSLDWELSRRRQRGAPERRCRTMSRTFYRRLYARLASDRPPSPVFASRRGRPFGPKSAIPAT